MANYKYLMLISSFLKVFIGVLHFINQPKVHFYQASYVIYSENPVGLPRAVSFWVLGEVLEVLRNFVELKYSWLVQRKDTKTIVFRTVFGRNQY